MSEIYVSPDAAIKGENPQWNRAGKVHDWRNHVPEQVRDIWDSFDEFQREALVKWADSLANDEEWE